MAPSPILEVFYAHHPIGLLCDSGAECSLIKLSMAVKLGLKLKPTNHSASQADGKTHLAARGEVHVCFTYWDLTLPMEAIVMEDLGCDVIGGAQFLEKKSCPQYTKPGYRYQFKTPFPIYPKISLQTTSVHKTIYIISSQGHVAINHSARRKCRSSHSQWIGQ